MEYSVNVNKVKENGTKNQGKKSRICGFANVVFGDSFKITNIAILENTEKNQLFVSMPRYKSSELDENGGFVYKDVCNPITREFREELYDTILQTYETLAEQDKKQEQEQGKRERAELPEFSVKVTPFEKEGSNIRGLARIYFDDSFIVNNVNILQGKENLFVAMPSYKTKQNDEQGKVIYQDICYPVTKEFREKLYGEVMKVYEQEKEKRHSEEQQGSPQQPQQAEKDREGQFQSVTERDTPFR